MPDLTPFEIAVTIAAAIICIHALVFRRREMKRFKTKLPPTL